MKTSAKAIPVLLMGALIALSPPGPSAQEKSSLQKITLENGLTVISQTDRSSAVTVLEILIRGGQKAEPAGKEGLAYLTTRLSLEIPDMGKVQELMEKSSRYLMTAKGDYSVIHIECLSEFLEGTLDVFVRILKEPLFSGMRIDRAKDYMNNQRKIESDDNLNVGHLTHLRTFLGHLGYGGTIYGTEESLKKIKSRDIEGFYERGFTPSNMTLLAVSDLEGDRLTGILKKFFGTFPLGKSADVSVTRVPGTQAGAPQETVLEKDTKQALVSVGFALPKVSPKDYALSTLLENLLGKGPGSLLWPLRTELKLAYNVNAQATVLKEGGILEAYLETDKAKTESARDALKKTLAELYENGVSAEVLRETMTFVRANFLRTNETKDRRASTLCGFEALGLGYDYFGSFFGELAAVTPDEFNAYLKEVLDPGKSALVIVGPKK
jgi:predicted Zn-dependent peptidase